MRRRQFLALLDRIERALPGECARHLRRLTRKRRLPFLKLLFQGILSHQTTARQEDIAIERLWARYDSLEKIAAARPGQILLLINNVGLGGIKARRIVLIARAIKERWRHERRLAGFLRTAPLEDAQRALTELPGVGPKTAAIVLLFEFDRPMFPVDTNIWRVAREMGWVWQKAGPEEVRAFVERRLPPDPFLYKKTHAYLLALGRATQRGRNRNLIALVRR